jgi:hypothetical protein
MPLIKAFLDEGEDLELLWLAGLLRDPAGGWLVRTVTRGIESKLIKSWRLPIGLLPLLAPGRCFSGGDPMTTFLRGEIAQIRIGNLADGEEVTSAAVPPEIFPAEGQKQGVQRLLRYRMDGVDILAPALELIRYLFIHNKTMANALMRPGGIMELFRPERIGFHEQLDLRFTAKMPVFSLTRTFVAEFAWIAIHPDGRRSWDSVSSLSAGQRYVTLRPPPLLNSDWSVRLIHWGNTALVLEILSATGKRHPCNALSYSHPSIRGSVPVRQEGMNPDAESLAGQLSKTREIRDYVVDDKATGSRIDVRQSSLAALSKASIFDRKIEITKMAGIASSTIGREPDLAAKSRLARAAREHLATQKITRHRVRVTASVAEESVDATLPPIDFKLLEPADPGYLGGLDGFIRVLRLMANMLSNVEIGMALRSLKRGRAFSMAGRYRRACLIAVLRPLGRPPLVMIDVDHSGQYALSTLVLKYRRPCTFREIEDHIATLLGGVVDNSGRWNTGLADDFADACGCARLPKVLRRQDRLDDEGYLKVWALRLIGQLGLEDLMRQS